MFISKLKALICICISFFFRLLNRDRVLVLMYHGVLPDGDLDSQHDWLQVTVSEFRSQMQYIKNHYQVVALKDLINNKLIKSTKPRAVITFDDGYANNFIYALPILSEYEIQATIFIATSHIGTKKLFWWDRMHLVMQTQKKDIPADWTAHLKKLPNNQINKELDHLFSTLGIQEKTTETPESYRSLTPDEVRLLISSGLIDIGSHTHNHEIILNLSDSEINQTLALSVETLNKLGANTKLFAAPNGDYLDSQIPILIKHGFECCLSTKDDLWDPRKHNFRIPRCPVGRGTSFSRFALKTSGFLNKVKRL